MPDISCYFNFLVDPQVDVPVRIIGGETVLVTFTGVGYDQRVMGNTLPVKDVGNTTVPAKQIVQVPRQVHGSSANKIYKHPNLCTEQRNVLLPLGQVWISFWTSL